MFYFVQKHRLVIGTILGLIALTFVGFGIGSYRWSSQEKNYLAKVGHLAVTRSDLMHAIERLKNTGNIEVTPLIQQQVLDELIGHNLLAIEAEEQGLMISDEQIAQIILSIPQLQENGQFNPLRYRYLLESRHETAKEFENAVRKQFLVQVQLAPFLTGQLVAQQQTDWLASLFLQKRMVQWIKFDPQAFLKQVNLTSNEVSSYYWQHLKDFKLSEAAKVDFILLPADAGVSISPNAIATYYETHPTEFEKRELSHILIQVPAQSTDAEKLKAKKQAETILKAVRLHPEQFSQLAKKHSQDPGSAAQGGNLGKISRGMTVKPFESAAFSLKAGQLSDIVTTQYGYHIIKVTAISKDRLNAVRSTIAAQLKEKASKAAARENSRQLAKMIYDHQPLSAIAKAIKRPIQHTGWLTQKQSTHPQLAQPKALAQIFNPNTNQSQKVSDVIRLEDGSLIVLQVIAKHPARMLTLKEATPTITQALKTKKASNLAINQGQNALRALQEKKSVSLTWQKPVALSLNTIEASLSPDAIRRIFSISVATLPRYIGFKTENGAYWLIRINAVNKTASTLSPSEKAQFAAQLEENLSFAQIAAYIKTLRNQTSVIYAKQP